MISNEHNEGNIQNSKKQKIVQSQMRKANTETKAW